jgi:isoquinoline 1-oxidoreductase subunit alpha
MIQFTLNGKAVSFDGDPDMPLLWWLRDIEKATGTKYGCGVAACGACTVHQDGAPVRSCSTPISAVAGTTITTIEGADTPAAKAIQAAWQEIDVVQCGYCQSGQIMTAAALLAGNANPSDADIDAALSGHICRCATYARIRAGVKRAAEILRG